MGRGGSTQEAAGAGPRRSSINYDSDWARPTVQRRHPEHSNLGVTIDTYEFDGQRAEIASGAAPFDAETGRVFDDHQVFHSNAFGGNFWVGADRPVPNRQLTNGTIEELGVKTAAELFARYQRGDYGEGEVGFAFYKVGEETVYLIDEAVRSPEGERPARDPETSPGPQKLMLPSEY